MGRRTALFALLLGTLSSVAAGCSSEARNAQAGKAIVRNESVPAPPGDVNPYRASLAYAKCMRRRGVPHPDPDRLGDFHLTHADERRLRRVGRKKVAAAEKACFHNLKGAVSTKPLSPRAQARAIKVLQGLRRCMCAHGYEMGKPVVRNMSRGRAFFGFEGMSPATQRASRTARYRRVQRMCEKGMAKKIDKIVREDRGEFLP